MEVLKLVTEVIDLRSFSNLWYWIALAVFWSSASHFVLGVPFDMVMRARREGSEEAADLDVLAHIQIRRMLRYVDQGGAYFVVVATFILSMLVTCAFYYQMEFAQAMFCLYFPLLIIIAITVWSARKISRLEMTGPALHKQLLVTRLIIQGLGILGILLTALWGMYVSLTIGPVFK
ncbi:component of SufBCD complex [Neogemmobacter tilapiae]|uniref:Component of SufBCD complex n=1 Tax=Neogemmobacter tilapiae TaxID=875041 RepID=A0A918TGI6_9RHOB|nr:component of SufBCD complex [Gemmobacter tilapiae]GHC45774.1 hypothetical protein GCM10007315_04120 [Gemmobacter tilapiae]